MPPSEAIMIKIWLWLIVFLISNMIGIGPVTAKPLKPDLSSPQVLVCFSGGQEIVRKNIVAGPFADEYKFAHEVRVVDEGGEHNLNFAGGLCIIDRGAVALKQVPKLTDELSCYSGAAEVVSFEVYGAESTVDEYVEGRTFFAKASGNSFDSNSLHEYLVFGGGACIGEETS